jgi:hypothetical protein
MAAAGVGVGAGFGLGQMFMQSMNPNMGSAVPAAGQGDPTQRLKSLKELLDQGLINQEEYEVKRKEIVSKL